MAWLVIACPVPLIRRFLIRASTHEFFLWNHWIKILTKERLSSDGKSLAYKGSKVRETFTMIWTMLVNCSLVRTFDLACVSMLSRGASPAED